MWTWDLAGIQQTSRGDRSHQRLFVGTRIPYIITALIVLTQTSLNLPLTDARKTHNSHMPRRLPDQSVPLLYGGRTIVIFFLLLLIVMKIKHTKKNGDGWKGDKSGKSNKMISFEDSNGLEFSFLWEPPEYSKQGTGQHLF